MMMMSMMDQKEKDVDPVEQQMLEMIEKQNKLLEHLAYKKKDNSGDRVLIDRIKKLENKLDEEEADEQDRNPMMDLFFLQNMMLAQNSVNNHFDPDHDSKSKQMQSFLMAQMLAQMNQVKAQQMLAADAKKEANNKKKNKKKKASEDDSESSEEED